MNSIKILTIVAVAASAAGCLPCFASDRDAFKVQIDKETVLKESPDHTSFAIGNDSAYCTYDFQSRVFTMVEGGKKMVVQLNDDQQEH
jgi:hypothetical protein